MSWKRINDNPPPKNEDVLFYDSHFRYIEVGRWLGGSLYKCGGGYEYPTHWMPLPPGPEDD